MWATLFRYLFAFLITRRGKRVIAFVGTMLLCFISALLIDARLYLSAAFTGVLAVVALIAFVTQYIRVRGDKRERERHNFEKAANKATRAEGRSERKAARKAARAEALARNIAKAKASVTGAASSVTNNTADMVGAAKTGFSAAGARFRSWREKKK